MWLLRHRVAMRESRLVWIDLEMTGLDPNDGNCIIEIATIVTEADLSVVAEGPVLAIVPKDPTKIDQMDEWNTRTHTDSGLVDRIRNGGVSVEEAEEKTLDFLIEHCPPNLPLAGSSVHHDRRFIRREMPRLDDFLSYRIVDVSSFKEVVRRWFPDLPRHKKPPNHKALEDIRGSISELKYYKDSIMKS